MEALGTGGLPIGILPGATFDEIRFSFGPGDRLLLFSDGLSEAENGAGEPFGEDRLRVVGELRAAARGDDGGGEDRERDQRQGGKAGGSRHAPILPEIGPSCAAPGPRNPGV